MPNYNNPASRLHAVLSRFVSLQNDARSVHKVWAQTFGVAPAQVPIELCRLGGLIPEIVELVHLGQDEHQIANVDHWSPAWAGILAGSALSNAASTGFIANDLLRNLGMTASYLGYVATEGEVPDEEQITALREAVSALLDEARGADTLPLDLRTALVRRLHDIIYALDHVQVVGPDGVQAAVERLVCAIELRGAEDGPDEDDGIVTRIQRTASRVYAAFLFGPTAYGALDSWKDIGQLMIGR